MAEVNGEPGFTQLDKLNITDELLIQGLPITQDAEKIVESAVPYTLIGDEDIVRLTGTGNVTLLSSSVADRSTVFYAATGTLTFVLQSGDTTNQAVVTVGNAVEMTPFPVSQEWIAL